MKKLYTKFLWVLFILAVFAYGADAADRYIDNTKESGTLTGANWQCTNGSGTVTETGAAGAALTELNNPQAVGTVGDWFRTTGGTQWYKVTAVADDDNFTISPVFQQGTVTAVGKWNDEDGSAVTQEFPHLNAAMTDEVRSAGDIIRVRGGQTHVVAGTDLFPDEDGTANDYIELRGIYTATGDDSWGDGDTTRPVIDFDLTAFQILFSSDDFWKISGLDVTQGNASSQILISQSAGNVLADCIIRDRGTGGGGGRSGVSPNQSPGFLISNCQFDDNDIYSLLVFRCNGTIKGCTFNGGTGGTTIGIRVAEGYIEIADSIFGVTTEHSTSDINLGSNAIVHCRNVLLDSTTQSSFDANAVGSVLIIEDDGQVHEALQTVQFTGNTSRSVVVERSGEGGTPWSILMEPNNNCGAIQTLYGLQGFLPQSIRGIPIFLDGTEQTITVYAYADSTAGGWTPNASEFRIEIEHIEGSGDWDIDVSSDTFAAEDQWESWSITLTPFTEGVGYLRAVLNDNVAGAKIYLDPTPEF